MDMHIAFTDDGGDGDLAVNYDASGLGDRQSLLVSNQFYRYGFYTHQLHELLRGVGFSAEAAADVQPSEQGMQEAGRASYDAELIADEVRSAADPSGILRTGQG